MTVLVSVLGEVDASESGVGIGVSVVGSSIVPVVSGWSLVCHWTAEASVDSCEC